MTAAGGRILVQLGGTIALTVEQTVEQIVSPEPPMPRRGGQPRMRPRVSDMTETNVVKTIVRIMLASLSGCLRSAGSEGDLLVNAGERVHLASWCCCS